MKLEMIDFSNDIQKLLDVLEEMRDYGGQYMTTDDIEYLYSLGVSLSYWKSKLDAEMMED